MKNKKKLTGAEVLLKSFDDLGINLLVGYTGGTIMPVLDKLDKFKDLKFVTCRHEQGAGFISQGYARASGKVAPLLVTSGPGVTNTVTPIADAFMDSVPMLVVSGQVAQDVVGTDAFQETDVLGIMYPITKYAILPDSVDDISEIVAKSLHIALHGRKGPVCIDLPKNLQFEETELIKLPEILDLPGLDLNPKISSKSKEIKDAIKLIKESKKPVVLVGHGVIISSTRQEVLKFIEKIKAPTALTMHGLSAIPSDHDLCLGMMGMHGEIEANKAIEEADLIIAFGMRFDDRVTGKLSEYAKNAKVIHIDIDSSEIDKNVLTSVGINADLKEALKVLNEELDKIDIDTTKREEFLKDIKKNRQLSKSFYRHIFEKGVGKSNKLLMSKIIHELSIFTDGSDNIVTDVGQHQMQTAKFYKFKKFNSWFSSGGLGTMGFGIPAGIGVKLARPDEEVWVIVGDGGAQMNIQELGTILQENLNINILLFNNSYLGMVRQWQDLFFDGRRAQTDMISPDFSCIAKAYGLSYKKVRTVDEINPALKWSKEENKATIVEFVCDSEEIIYPMVPPGNTLSEMLKNHDDAKNKLNI